MTGRRLIVIIDGAADGAANDHVAEWQRRALAALPATDRLTLLVCTNTSLKRQPLRFPLYYALNLLTVRNPLTRAAGLDGVTAAIEARHSFASEADGAWQKLPEDIVTLIAESGADAVIKLGMGLMRVPPSLTIPTLSWHHGDSEHFRGRPAGFWELLAGRPVIGQIVQVIGNKLDAGAIVAFAETRATAHSWRASLVEAFRHSPLLLAPALDNALAGRTLAKPVTGRNYRLPSNWQVVRLMFKLGAAKARRLAYGAMFEKRWRVSVAPVADAGTILDGTAVLPPETTWWTPPNPDGCSFIADPFFAEDSATLLVEALSARSGTGEIHRIRATGSTRLSADSGHHSYPALVEQDGVTFCVPEIAQWSAPAAYRWQDGWERAAELDIAGAPRLTDPTFLRHEGRLYLFANIAAEGSNVLRLWSADGLFVRFTEHPASPVRISPRGSRMGGAFLQAGERTLRIGQDFTRDYGDGLVVFAIDVLSADSYREHEVGAFRFADRKGPHSFNLAPDGGSVVFDWYRDGFTPLAGFRRLNARLSRR
ncbi:MAG: hypothetical protein Q8R44_05155 [Novosphingobium sp.]|nr:hypothetical protein [Novosphingobium sp.]